jgi:hypothetical protein
MLSPSMYAALAHERHETLLAQAKTDRRARQARLHRRQAAGRPVVLLRDGSAVLIRPVQSADVPLLADGFARLSDRSRQLRFLAPKKALSPAELRYFTDVDHHDHEALGALNHADGRGVGIARYVRDADDAQAAEIAVTIIDDWHGRGLRYEIMLVPAEQYSPAGVVRSSNDPPGLPPDPATPESAAVTNSGWAQRRLRPFSSQGKRGPRRAGAERVGQ